MKKIKKIFDFFKGNPSFKKGEDLGYFELFFFSHRIDEKRTIRRDGLNEDLVLTVAITILLAVVAILRNI